MSEAGCLGRDPGIQPLTSHIFFNSQTVRIEVEVFHQVFVVAPIVQESQKDFVDEVDEFANAIFIVAIQDPHGQRYIPAPVVGGDSRLPAVNPPVVDQFSRLTGFDEAFQLPIHLGVGRKVGQYQREAHGISARIEDKLKNAIPVPEEAEDRPPLPDRLRPAESAEDASPGVAFERSGYHFNP